MSRPCLTESLLNGLQLQSAIGQEVDGEITPIDPTNCLAGSTLTTKALKLAHPESIAAISHNADLSTLGGKILRVLTHELLTGRAADNVARLQV